MYLEVADAFGVTVEFLQRRETKETPQPELALANCKDQMFVGRFLAYEDQKAFDAGATLDPAEQLLKPRSPREILQVWGTEYRREMYSDDYWRAQVAKVVKANPDVNYVITDVRFPDEGLLVEGELKGQLGRIRRPGLGGADDKALLHASEVAMLDYPIALEFINEEGEEGLANFRAAVVRAYH
ncbi:hypothetical protein WJ84_02485 [Burkholderia ubonensis]|nr:hypothetical protein WJ84_02485 [Burkholderia ubonensis]KVP39710.1 hypothetical protein WJ87_05870 [Burkholderia ubonensis]